MILTDLVGMGLVATDLRDRYHRGDLKSAGELAEGTKLVNAMQAIYNDLLARWPRESGTAARKPVPRDVMSWLESLHAPARLQADGRCPDCRGLSSQPAPCTSRHHAGRGL